MPYGSRVVPKTRLHVLSLRIQSKSSTRKACRKTVLRSLFHTASCPELSYRGTSPSSAPSGRSYLGLRQAQPSAPCEMPAKVRFCPILLLEQPSDTVQFGRGGGVGILCHPAAKPHAQAPCPEGQIFKYFEGGTQGRTRTGTPEGGGF